VFYLQSRDNIAGFCHFYHFAMQGAGL